MPSDYYEVDTNDRAAMYNAAKTLQDEAWSDYCSLDYWIKDMGQLDTVPNKQVLKMAMKHLRDNLYNVSGFLARIEEGNHVE